MNKKMILTFVLYVFGSPIVGQSCLYELTIKDIFIGIEQPILLVNNKKEFIDIEIITATFEDYETGLSHNVAIINENGNYKIKPNKIGRMTLFIRAESCEIKKTLNVKPITATPRIGLYTSNENKKINWAELLAHSGLIANIECCDISGKCVVLDYEVFLIQSNSKVLKSINKGERFSIETIEIFKNSKPNDMILFRNIRYKCPGTEDYQRMADMTLEIK